MCGFGPNPLESFVIGETEVRAVSERRPGWNAVDRAGEMQSIYGRTTTFPFMPKTSWSEQI
jgi:hypothetical protein